MSGPLRLGVVVPRFGPLAAEGLEVVRAVRSVVDAANADDQAGDDRIELMVRWAEDRRGVAEALESVDALVGGFGARDLGRVSWLLPADPVIAGPNVVGAELSPEAAGAALGADLRSRDRSSTVGVVVADGAEAGFADGLAKSTPLRRVDAIPGSSCDHEIFKLRVAGATALAVAGPPEVQARCADSAARQAWRPRGGVLLPPSSVYARLHLRPSLRGARTMLGFPWPSSRADGAARYRAALPESSSYRALVSFAAAELAVHLARGYGGTSASLLTGATLRSDLYTYDGGVNRGASVVAASSDGWFPVTAPPQGGSGSGRE